MMKAINETMSAIFGVLKPAEVNQVKTDISAPFMMPALIARHRDTEIDDETTTIRAAMTEHAPFRRVGIMRVDRPESMTMFINRFRDEGSVLFVDAGTGRGADAKPVMTAIINFHHAGSERFSITGESVGFDGYGEETALGPNGRDPLARKCDHGARYFFPVSDEYLLWKKVGENGLTQAQLGNFIEERVGDFITPTQGMRTKDIGLMQDQWEAPMIDLARQLAARFGDFSDLKALALSFEVDETSTLKIRRNPQTGEMMSHMETAHNTASGEPISIPGLFMIAIPVFVGGPLYRMAVRFSYRKKEGKIVFFLSVYNIDSVFIRSIENTVEHVVKGTCLLKEDGSDEVDMGTGIPVIWGTIAAG